jgi:hypothetical protein
MSQAFREYATRVSFSIQLTRNQIYTLWVISQARFEKSGEREAFGLKHDMFIPGAKWLQARGLVDYTDPTSMKPPHATFPYTLTLAGTHILSLLEIAGLVPFYKG